MENFDRVVKKSTKNPWNLNQNHHHKIKIYIRAQNVRTLREDNRIDKPENELECIKWNVIGLSELRRWGKGWQTLKSGNVLLHKGRKGESINEVGFIIPKQYSNRFISFTAISDQVGYKIHKVNSTHNKDNSIYTFTTNHDYKEDEFYYHVKITINGQFRKDHPTYTLVLRDSNATLGKSIDVTENQNQEYLSKLGTGHGNEKTNLLLENLNEKRLYAIDTFL